MLIINPAFIISFCGTNPDENTIAFGGVPAGIINPKDAAIVAGKTRIMGLICISFASEKRSGKIMAALAVLLINSVRIIVKITTANKNTNIGTIFIRLETFEISITPRPL